MSLRPLAGWDCGLESCRGHGRFSVLSVVCCPVEGSATGRLLVQRSPADCYVSECDREVSVIRMPWSTRGCCEMGGGTTFK